MGNKHDLQGKRFGKWTVIKEDGRIGSNVAWLCRCDCGNVARVRATALVNGYSKSCGCNRIHAITTHNATGTPLFDVWRNIKERCTNPNYKTYGNYGGRGIKVCDEWLESFESFYEWAVNNGYKQGLSIDRIDVDGNYEPSNCRWETNKVQARNKRNTVFLEHNGVRKRLIEWSELLGVNYKTLNWRRYQGWSTEEILFGRS